MGRASRDKGALCECGCGGAAPLASANDAARGRVKGRPLRFIHGHNSYKNPDELYERVDLGYKTECWRWLGGRSEHYGRAKHDGRMKPAHRAVWETRHGPVPEGLVLDHLCFQPLCVNPDHLEPVTPLENQRRKRNLKLTAEDVAAIRQARADALAANPLTAQGHPRRRVAGGLALRERLAEQYGVGADYIKEIWRGDRWAK